MTMNEYTTLLTTVNAPYAKYMDANTLALCLSDGEFTSGQVDSFFTEVPMAKQISFAKHFDIPVEKLKTTAQAFGNWSGQTFALLP